MITAHTVQRRTALFFFFQAEDGIRDWSVTGVQTCALPIWVFSPSNLAETASALRMKNYKVQGASSVTKQRCEFEMLLRGAPMPNPQLIQMQAGLEKVTSGMQAAQLTGQPIPPEAAA